MNNNIIVYIVLLLSMLSFNEKSYNPLVSYINKNYKVPKNYKLGLCHLFHPRIHGFDKYSDPNVLGHYLVIHIEEDFEDDDVTDVESIYTEEDEEEDDSVIKIEDIMRSYKKIYRNLSNTNQNYYKHPIIKNYANIISNPNYIQLEIIQRIYLKGDECVAILKTFWIRIIQKTWKKIYSLRKNIIEKRTKLNAILYSELHGKWPDNCSQLPTLKGMLI